VSLKLQKDTAVATWNENNRELLNGLTQAGIETAEAEAKLRELTLQVYAETGNKSPTLGVGIREITKLQYDSVVAFDWAVEHKMAIKLGTSAFEKIAKASPLGFVDVSLEPQATIAADLDI